MTWYDILRFKILVAYGGQNSNTITTLMPDDIYLSVDDVVIGSGNGLSTIQLRWNYLQGAVSIRKTVLPGMAIPMLKIRRPNGRLIFNMEIAIRR